jgi:hypothetical protein
MKLKTAFLSPFFAPIFTIGLWMFFIGIGYLIRAIIGPYDVELNWVTEEGTYVAYALSFVTLFMVAKDYLKTPLQNTYLAIATLWTALLLREMGIQHWLTKHDTTAIKIRFFTNPNNPLHEKIITIALLALVGSVAIYLLVKYCRKLFAGFFKLDMTCWTIASFAGAAILSQLADRFPSRWAKMHNGARLEEPVLFFSKLFEETGEILLPVLFSVALWQCYVKLRTPELQDAESNR